MKNFCVLLLSMVMFIISDTTCMFRLCALHQKRSRLPKRIFSKSHYWQDSDRLIAQINELEKTLQSNQEIMFEQHRIINDLKDQLKLSSRNHNPAYPISQKNHTNLQYLRNSYIPEHNMHYGNKDQE